MVDTDCPGFFRQKRSDKYRYRVNVHAGYAVAKLEYRVADVTGLSVAFNLADQGVATAECADRREYVRPAPVCRAWFKLNLLKFDPGPAVKQIPQGFAGECFKLFP